MTRYRAGYDADYGRRAFAGRPARVPAAGTRAALEGGYDAGYRSYDDGWYNPWSRRF